MRETDLNEGKFQNHSRRNAIAKPGYQLEVEKTHEQRQQLYGMDHFQSVV